jgi:glycosyltransferase involved in cell wall biosynthesis
MKFALVTTCKNENPNILLWKRDVIAQTQQPDEICIVDGISTDGTWEILKDWAKTDPRVKIYQEKSNPARGRNLAVKMTTCDYFVSTDMGCRLDRDWFLEITLPFQKSTKVTIVAGYYEADRKTISTNIGWADYYLHNGYRASLSNEFLPSNRSVAFKKSTWDEYGGLPEYLKFAGDDTYLGMKIRKNNIDIHFAPKAIIYWNRPNTLFSLNIESYNYGFGDGEINKITLDLKPHRKTFIHFLIILSRKFPKKKVLKGIFIALKENKIIASLLIIPLFFSTYKSYYSGFYDGYSKIN